MYTSLIDEIFDAAGPDADQLAEVLQALLDAKADREIIMGAAFRAGAVTILSALAELKGESLLVELQAFIEEDLERGEGEDA
jgi:hypothetical protein